jgi:hypothetical protein
VHAWAALINEFPDRFLFGSDALNPQVKDTWAETGNMYKPLLDQLTPEARVAVKTGNYDRVLTEARPKVRAFEQHVLTRDFVEKGLRSSGDGRVNDGPHIDPEALRAAGVRWTPRCTERCAWLTGARASAGVDEKRAPRGAFSRLEPCNDERRGELQPTFARGVSSNDARMASASIALS